MTPSPVAPVTADFRNRRRSAVGSAAGCTVLAMVISRFMNRVGDRCPLAGVTLRLHAPQVKRASARRGLRDPHLKCARYAERHDRGACFTITVSALLGRYLAWTRTKGSLGWPVSTCPSR